MKIREPLRPRRGILRLFLCCCIASHRSHVRSEEAADWESGTIGERSEYFYKTWTSMYGLDPATLQPPPALVSLPGGLPPLAPHLLDCSLEAAKAEAAEALGGNGEVPEWWGEGEGGGPEPPWVRGGDEDNLPLTRIAQAGIWRHQHPVDCSNETLKFLWAPWGDPRKHGPGSQFHVMTAVLSHAMTHGRILVVEPKSYPLASEGGCVGDASGSLECYFESMTSPECTERGVALMAEGREESVRVISRDMDRKEIRRTLGSEARVVKMDSRPLRLKFEARAAGLWGSPWRSAPPFTELMGKVASKGGSTDELDGGIRPLDQGQVQWWRAQAIRYMMRWPSPYLCHVTNRVRHVTMGRRVANQVALSEFRQRKAAGKGREGEGLKNGGGVALGGGGEAYMPRPIVSLHVRQGDKAKEMRLFSFAAHMWMAERLRFHVPNLDHVWLTAIPEAVVERAKEYDEWTFWYTRNDVRNGTESARLPFHTTLANLLITVECDYFIGTLGSNWNRLIDELRLTNGRMRAGYIALNLGQW